MVLRREQISNPAGEKRKIGELFDDESELLAWIESHHMDRSAQYLRCGRSFSHLTDTKLLKCWEKSLKALASDPFSKNIRNTESDIRIEIEQRGLELPFGSVEGSIAVLSEKLMEHFDQELLHHPQEFQDAVEAAGSEFEAFRRRKNRVQH